MIRTLSPNYRNEGRQADGRQTDGRRSHGCHCYGSCYVLVGDGSGGAIICGTPESTGFTGTLSPLIWSTEVYEASESEKIKATELYKQVVKALKEYRCVLESIRKGDTIEANSAELEKAYAFFRSLARVFMRQADPITRTYSRQA